MDLVVKKKEATTCMASADARRGTGQCLCLLHIAPSRSRYEDGALIALDTVLSGKPHLFDFIPSPKAPDQATAYQLRTAPACFTMSLSEVLSAGIFLKTIKTVIIGILHLPVYTFVIPGMVAVFLATVTRNPFVYARHGRQLMG